MELRSKCNEAVVRDRENHEEEEEVICSVILSFGFI